MKLYTPPSLASVAMPPIADAQQWVAGYDGSHGPLINVAQAVPSWAPAGELTDHLCTRLSDPSTALYTAIEGLPALRERLAADLAGEYRGAIAADQVAITAGCNQAFCAALSALAGPGDEVIVPLPYYFNHAMWLQMQGIGLVGLPFEGDGVPSVAAARALLTPRTRAIVLVTPNNPTGTEYPPATIESFFELAREAGIALVLDETYKDFRSDPAPPHGLFARADWADHLVQLYSFSKAYSLTGYRVGSIVAGHALHQQIAKILDCVAICAPHIGQEAALFGLEHLTGWRDARATEVRHRHAAMRAALDVAPGGFRVVASGGFFAYVEHPFAGQDARDVARSLAADFGVLSLPGTMFGSGQSRYLRFAYANLETARMPELAARLVRVAAQGH